MSWVRVKVRSSMIVGAAMLSSLWLREPPVEVLHHCGRHLVRPGQPLQLEAGVVHVEILQNGERGDVVNVGVATWALVVLAETETGR